jgi:hypothetical protein
LNRCYPRLITVAAFAAAIFLHFGAQAQNSCPTGTAAITSPGAGITVPSTVTVTVSASSNGNCDITALRLYVDYQTYYTITSGGSPSAGFSIPTLLGPGYHLLNVVAWDDAGDSFVSPGTEVYVAPQDQTVYITNPGPNQNVTTSVSFIIAARARWDNADITYMRVYVDGVDECDFPNPQNAAISCQKAFNPGQHDLVVIAWSSGGEDIKAQEYFTVTN